ncbi:mycothiol transferase [Marinitenerispora sediminis]
MLLHVLRETAQHAGHADIIRESLDGANTTATLMADITAGARG